MLTPTFYLLLLMRIPIHTLRWSLTPYQRTKHERSKIAALQGKLDEAYQLSKEAHDLVSVGKPTHASVMATQYRMGCIAMLQGDHYTALEHLKRALVISQLNEAQRGNAGESSWVRWRMAELYENDGNLEDAQILRDSALATKKDLLAGGEYAIVEDADGSWGALVGLLYR
jgi:tetratricopeptide (TPR) repeat protein